MSPKLAKRHKTHETWRHSETAPARAHLVETRSPWDQHTLARDALTLNPNLLPQYHSVKVPLQSVLRRFSPAPNLGITLGE